MRGLGLVAFPGEDDASLRLTACERLLRRVAGRQASGRVGGPVVLETVPAGDGGLWRVQVRNEQTGGVIVLGDI